MTAQCAISDRRLTIDDLPESLPAVIETTPYDQHVPAMLGGDPVTLPPQMPAGLAPRSVQEVAAALAAERRQRASQTSRRTPEAAGADGSVIDKAACARLLGFLAQVPDQRDRRGVRYPLPYLLALPIVAMTAHEVQLAGIGEWVADAPEDLLLALGAPLDDAGVARRPDVKAITEALAEHADGYDRALCAWTGALARDQHQHRHRHARGPLLPRLHIDGKSQKGAAPRGGSAPMLLAARRDDGTVAAQRPVATDKTNEITVFAPLLDQLGDAELAGTVVTADQLHTQRGHATYLHRRDAFYVFTVGGNQKRLFAALDALPWRQIAVEHATVDRGHGRIEIRTIRTLPVTERIAGLFPHAAQAFLLERYIYTTDGTPVGAVAVLGITSLTADQADGAAILAYVRGHWSIESLHWLRDRVLGEDDSRQKRAIRAMAALRNLVIGVLHLRGITRISRQLRACGRDPYRRPLILLGLMT
ncbi:ISAs1 family transposase [Sphaerimonospora thailandensis]|uniref:ISAs1 family transposase n=1 Tax=Sphaerimonospora thailandensis TaxID=795644 RepID=A0A8J3W2R7_9ACTN|nr:ISAs1 family transposase [Sphaerimonospora thailandensis]GIH73550.1 ISAs1 family transposase [Sphaerimonospora thailandensis]